MCVYMCICVYIYIYTPPPGAWPGPRTKVNLGGQAPPRKGQAPPWRFNAKCEGQLCKLTEKANFRGANFAS